jgi:signal transduction histidine kinase
MTIELSPLDLGSLLAATAADLRHLFDRRGIRLEVVLPDRPVMILGHNDRMTQVIVNLVGNGIKYARGLVRILLERQGDQARIMVDDDGTGIPTEKLVLIFEAFLQAQHHEQKEGTGLGLAIVRQIVIGHHGRVWAENRGDATGARFIVEIPLLETVARQRESEVEDGLPLSPG